MRWSINGKLVWKNDKKYLIDWRKPSRSKEQTKIKEFLEQYWEKDIVYEEYVLPSTRLRVDFLNPTKKIAWEHQGKGAHEFNKFFNKGSRANYLASIKRDVKKAKFLESNGYTLIETYTTDLEKLLNREFFYETYGVWL